MMQACALPRLPVGTTKPGLPAAVALVQQACPGVIGRLWQQAADVDAVGRAEAKLLCQRAVGQRGLDQSLAVVERTLHGDRQHVVAPAGQLLRLPCATPCRRETARRPACPALIERGRDRTAGVTRSRDQDGQRRRRVTLEPAQARRKKSGADILERRRRPVEQLQQLRIAAGRVQWRQGQRKVQGLGDNRGQLVLQRRALEERREQDFGHAARRIGRGKVCGAEMRQLDRHIQAAVRGNARDQRLRKAHLGRAARAAKPYAHCTMCAPGACMELT